jgi:hypothetical protein
MRKTQRRDLALPWKIQKWNSSSVNFWSLKSLLRLVHRLAFFVGFNWKSISLPRLTSFVIFIHEYDQQNDEDYELFEGCQCCCFEVPSIRCTHNSFSLIKMLKENFISKLRETLRGRGKSIRVSEASVTSGEGAREVLKGISPLLSGCSRQIKLVITSPFNWKREWNWLELRWKGWNSILKGSEWS